MVRIAGVEVPHRLWSPGELARTFAPEFFVSRMAGQGILRPVDDPGETMSRWERALSRLPGFRNLGTFFSLELVRERIRRG